MPARCDLLLTNALVATMDEQFTVHEAEDKATVIVQMLERTGARAGDVVAADCVELWAAASVLLRCRP